MLDSLNDDEEFKSDEELDAYADSLLDAIQNGATIKDVQGISSDTMQDMYKLAYDFYHQGKLNDAESLFRFLCIYDFYNPEYAMGLAAILQLKKNYAKAIDFYALAYSLSKEDYRPMFYAGQCNLMLRQAVPARKCFDIVINRCSDAELCQKAGAYISALNNLKNDEVQDAKEDPVNEE